jgi:hypothetical protein
MQCWNCEWRFVVSSSGVSGLEVRHNGHWKMFRPEADPHDVAAELSDAGATQLETRFDASVEEALEACA